MFDSQVQIHEFSTGINAEILSDGKWRSRGFKVGEYMNSTLTEIPYSVARVIANKRFEVVVGTSSDRPAVVAGVASGETEDDDWSVIAVVTPCPDEFGRTTAVYRYFLCQGADNIWKIAAWMDNYKQRTGEFPVFNPTEIPDKPNIWNAPKPNLNLAPVEDWLNSNPVPIIIQPGQPYTLQVINEMAAFKAKGQPVSWAYNVEALERPELFQIIQAANEKAHQQITQTRNSLLNSPRMLPPGAGVDEQALESAIKAAISNKNEAIPTIISTCKKNKLTEAYLQNIFDNLGATNAINQQIYTPEMVRLLTLRAIFIPNTLPDYLDWLGIDNKEENDRQQTSLQFQLKLKQFIELAPLVTEGLKITLNKLAKENLLESLIWLLTRDGGLWKQYGSYLLQYVRDDLQIISESKGMKPDPRYFSCGDLIWKSLWQAKSYRIPIYEPLAKLFIGLKEYDLAAYFYQVSRGKVPPKIFDLALEKTKTQRKWNRKFSRWSQNVLGLEVFRQLTPKDYLKKNALPIAATTILLLTHLMAFLGGYLIRGYMLAKAKDTAESNSNNPEVADQKKPVITTNNQNNNSRYNNDVKSKQDFDSKTKPALDKIVSDLQSDSELSSILSQDIKKAIKETLGNDKFDYTAAVDGEANQRKILVNEILSYQQQKKISSDGIISPEGKTFNQLKKDVKIKLLQKKPPSPQ